MDSEAGASGWKLPARRGNGRRPARACRAAAPRSARIVPHAWADTLGRLLRGIARPEAEPKAWMAGRPRLATFGERRRNRDLVQLGEIPAGLPIRVQQEISLGEPEAETDTSIGDEPDLVERREVHAMIGVSRSSSQPTAAICYSAQGAAPDELFSGARSRMRGGRLEKRAGGRLKTTRMRRKACRSGRRGLFLHAA
jgi:hypothetical protein